MLGLSLGIVIGVGGGSSEVIDYNGFALLLEGGTDHMLLEGDATSGTDILLIEGFS